MDKIYVSAFQAGMSAVRSRESIPLFANAVLSNKRIDNSILEAMLHNHEPVDWEWEESDDGRTISMLWSCMSDHPWIDPSSVKKWSDIARQFKEKQDQMPPVDCKEALFDPTAFDIVK